MAHQTATHTSAEMQQAIEECTEDCERLAGDDQMLKDCAEECRRCPESCERMAA